MKRCTHCDRTYDDDSLRFCLQDGTVLVSASVGPNEPPATVLYSDRASEVNSPQAELNTRSNKAFTTDVSPGGSARPTIVSGSSNRALTAAVIAIGLVLIVIATVGVLLLWRQTQRESITTQTAGNSGQSPAVAGSPVRSTSTSMPDVDQENLESQKGLTIGVTASSVRLSVQSNTYVPGNVIDGSRKTAWIEGKDGPGSGEWLRFDFGREINLHRLIVLPGYFKSAEIWKQNNRLASATIYFSNGSSRLIYFPDKMERQSIDLGSVKTRWIRLEIGEIYPGTDPDTAISEVVFEWES